MGPSFQLVSRALSARKPLFDRGELGGDTTINVAQCRIAGLSHN